MKVEINVPEAVKIFNGIQKRPEMVFDLIREDIDHLIAKNIVDKMSLKQGR